MNKAEIISKTLKEMGFSALEAHFLFGEEQDEEEFIIAVLQERLPDVDIRTCEDFRHLNVECCETCHDNPHHELSLINLPDGGKAWVCDEVEWAMYPERRKDLESSPEAELLRQILGSHDQ